ncbi:hypothetical protein [Pelagibius sp.]|uniref:hypothetical protein n=1 Tax=Pelagibius sp. TaxID=1931238 RepID=UPI002604E071|nr:hypothetical protein [Pelagibius sp.]
MATFNEQILRAWEEWETTTGEDANNPNDFIDWAISNGKLAPRPEDIRKIFRRQLSTALRQAMRIDEEGTTYRAKQCVSIMENGEQRTLWFDVDRGGTPQLRQKAVRQRRDSIANDIYRAMSDVEHMNLVYPEDEPLQFELDFTEDYEERKALEALEKDQKDAS